MEINFMAVILATVAQFAVGAVWYMVLFPKAWGEIHGFNKYTKEEQKKMQSQMGPYYVAQVLMTALTSIMLAKLIVLVPNYSPFTLALIVWSGFIVPTQVSAVIFGGTESKWISKKINIMAGGALACILVAASVIGAM